MKRAYKLLSAFLLGLLVRAVPELASKFPIGSDTPAYMYLVLEKSDGFLRFPESEILGYYGGKLSGAVQALPNLFYYLLGLLGKLGADPELVFRAYPPVAYGLLVLLSSLLLLRLLRLGENMLLPAALAVALNPAALRISWDLHRQVFGLLLAEASLLAALSESRLLLALACLLGVLTGFTHELSLLVLLAALIAVAAEERSLPKTLPALLGALAFAASYSPVIPKLWSLAFVSGYTPPGTTFTSAADRLAWWLSVLLVSGGYLLPGTASRPRSSVLLAWFAASFAPYASFLGSPLLSIALPERFLFLWFLPLSGFLISGLSNRKLRAYAVAGIMLLQASSMLGVYGGPLPPFRGLTFNVFVDHMTTSLPEADIEGLRYLGGSLSSGVVLVEPTLTPWSLYELGGKLVVDTRMDGWWVIAGDAGRNKSLAVIWYKGSSPPGWLCRLKPENHYARLVLYRCG